jgi:hypothetical protein
LFTEPDNSHRRWLIVSTALSAAVLLQIRGLSPLLFALIAVGLLVLAGWRRVGEVLRRRDARIGLGIVVACGVFAVGWILGAGALRIAPVGTPVDRRASVLAIARVAVSRALKQVKDMAGLFGWEDTPPPHFVYDIWGLVVVLLIVAALYGHPLRSRLVVLAIAALTVLLPAALALSQVHADGLIGQARYTMPLTVGLPIVSAHLISARHWHARWRPPALLVGGLLLAAAHAGAFVQALHRYRTGLQVPLLTWHAGWSPPAPVLAILAVFGICDLLLVLCWWLVATADDDRAGTNTAPSIAHQVQKG